MASSTYRWRTVLMTSAIHHLGRRNLETGTLKTLFTPRRSFFTVHDADSFNQANTHFVEVASKSPELNQQVRGMASFESSRDILRDAVRQPNSCTSSSTELAELLGCEPHLLFGSRMQCRATRGRDLISTIKAAPLRPRDGLAHNVILEW